MADFDARSTFAEAPVAQLATVGPDAVPHLVPVVFALFDDVVYTAIDAKRKTTHRLRRLANIEANPGVCLLVHHYDDDWGKLWWVRADGVAAVHHSGEERAAAYDLLRRKYPQYERVALDGPAVAITVRRWSWWTA
ncbi:MAG: TIGR03668 family PPOX class F420-dependent oxidoreductase [Mycobacteriaceae bacterium]|nr:TIGR03668 family PPOX class F420-dependent oxidoreductase [Mycobacteriaceae bacterium]